MTYPDMKKQMIWRWLTVLAVMCSMAVGAAFGQEAADADSAISAVDTIAVAYKDFYKLPCDSDSITAIHPSNYDYSELAKEIVNGCDDDYQRLKAIYGWICENIDYDTKFAIYSADKCMEAKRGTCQAYCELFYQITKALNIRTEIIKGKAKDDNGYIDSGGHAWIFAYTRENHGILMDPTWGAGTVSDGKFTKNDDCWTWFGVEPEWMILSHYPDKASYQLLELPVTQEKFVNMQRVSLLAREYGIDVHYLYEKALADSLSLPKLTKESKVYFRLIEVPLQEKLQIGEMYQFRIKMLDAREFAIINNNIFCKNAEWTHEGDSVYSVSFMPRDTTDFCIAVRSDKEEHAWEAMVEYGIVPPSAADWEKVGEAYPLSVPELRNVKNINADIWNLAGIDVKMLAELLRQQHVTELPKLYRKNAGKLKIEQVPMNKRLKVGETYIFRFKPVEETNWALINNKLWHRSWKVEDGTWSMQVVPKESGTLMLMVQTPENKSFWSCMEYEVTEE